MDRARGRPGRRRAVQAGGGLRLRRLGLSNQNGAHEREASEDRLVRLLVVMPLVVHRSASLTPVALRAASLEAACAIRPRRVLKKSL